MIEVFFYLFLILISVMTAWGLREFSPPLLLMAGVLALSFGLILLVEGVEREPNIKLTKLSSTEWDANVTSQIRTTENDVSILIIANLFFFGAFPLWLIAFVAIFQNVEPVKGFLRRF